MINYMQILQAHYPTSGWSIEGNSYEGIIWGDQSPKPSKDELDNLWASVQQTVAKQNCQQTAKKLIAATDWSVLPDVNLVNKSEFESYRAALRALIINPVADPVYPTEPTPVWS